MTEYPIGGTPADLIADRRRKIKDGLLLGLLGRPIAFHRSLVPVAGSVNAALMLSQALYWQERTNDPEGWFYKTREEWEEETCLTRREQEGARSLMRPKGYWQEKQASGMDRRLYYRVVIAALIEGLETVFVTDAYGGNRPMEESETARWKGAKPTIDARDPLPCTETTSETTCRETRRRAAPSLSEDAWDAFASLYPDRDGGKNLAKGKEKFKAFLKGGVDPEEILAGTQRYRSYCDHAGLTGTPYVRMVTTFLNQESWREEWAVPVQRPVLPVNGRTNGTGTTAEFEASVADLAARTARSMGLE